MSIDKKLLKALRDDINKALKSVAEKHGVGLDLGNASYNDQHANFKLKVSSKNESGETITEEMSAFNALHKLYGLEKDMLFKTFMSNGSEYEIIGLKPRSHKYPILARELSSKKTFKFPAEVVKERMDKTV